MKRTRYFLLLFAVATGLFITGQAQTGQLSLLAEYQSGDFPIWLYSVREQGVMQAQPPFDVDTCRASYLVASGRRDTIWLIVTFDTDALGRARASFYQAPSPQLPLRYRVTGRGLEVIDGLLPTVRLVTREPVSDRQHCWLEEGVSTYNLELSVDGALGFSTDGVFPTELPDGEVDIVNAVYGANGVPTEQVAELVSNPDLGNGRRLRVTQRMKDAPPFAVMDSLFEDFAYFNVGEPLLGSRWFTENWSPIYFDLETRRLQVVDFVGFKMGGTYWVNSSAYGPEVNFESPMAFYSFDPSNRYTHLIVRADHGFDTSGLRKPVPEMGFRYSWKNSNGKDWRYSLQLLGTKRYPGHVTIAETELSLVPYDDLPTWVMDQHWPVMTFVESVGGYGGGEGIYYYTVQGGLAYRYLAGRSDTRPNYFDEPYLTDTTRLSDYAVRGLPVNFRGEYGAIHEGEPQLYFSEVDGRVHLDGAGGGVWHLGADLVLRSGDLNGDGMIDSWWRQRPGTPLTSEGFTTAYRHLPAEERFSILPGEHFLYQGDAGLELVRYTELPASYPMRPPIDRESWQTFRNELKAYEQATPPKDPYDLASWRWEEGTELLSAPGAQLSSLWVEAGLVEMGFSAPGGGRFQGQALPAGDHVLSYRVGTDTWQLDALKPIRIEAEVDRQGATELVLTNTGNVTFNGPVALETQGEALFDWRTVTVAPGAARRLELDFIPQTVLKQAETVSFAGVAPPTAFPLGDNVPNRPPPYELFRLSSTSGSVFAALITFILTSLLASLAWVWRRVR